MIGTKTHVCHIDDSENDILYNIVYQYQNGDQEDMNEKECKQQIVIDIYIQRERKLDSGEINEWEMGVDEQEFPNRHQFIVYCINLFI